MPGIRALFLLGLTGLALGRAHGQTGLNERRPNFIAAQTRDTKLQLSQTFEFMEGVPVYGAYTLRGLWLRHAPSAPFKEIAHHPEVFWRSPAGEWGLEHESNGLDNHSADFEGVSGRSRSLQRVYWYDKYIALYRGLRLGLKLMAPLFVMTRPDYHEYMGFFDLELERQTKHISWTGKYRRGVRGGRFLFELSCNPMIVINGSLAQRNRTWLFIEHYAGYAETLVDYNQRSVETRAGLRLLL